MKPLLLYILETVFCNGLLIGFYRLLLVRKVGFASCRRFLVAAVLLSALIPALDIPLYPARPEIYPLPLIGREAFAAAAGAAVPVGATQTVPSAAARSVDWPHVLRICVGTLWCATTAAMLLLFAVRVATICRLRRRSRLTDRGAYWLAESDEVKTPFSFLRTIFLGEGVAGCNREMVLCHESSHIRHRHSTERIVIELMRCLCWYNPFVWIASRWLGEVQEWEADRDVLDAGYDLTEYRTVIFRQLFGYNPDIACGLNRSLTKTRFVMMKRCQERRFAFLRLGAAIPVVAGMMLLCSFSTRMPEKKEPVDKLVSEVHIGSDGRITFNGREIDRDSLAAYVAAEREKLSEADRARMEIRLVADPGERFGTLHAAREALRRVRALRVRYAMPSGQPDVQRMLPPEPGVYGKVKVLGVEMPAIKERNLFLVQVSGVGSVTAGQPGRQRPVDENELPAMVEAFVLNESDDPAGPEKTMKEISLANGNVGRYPVSEGVVSLQVDPAAPYAAFIGVQRALAQGFARARDVVAKRWLGAPSYETLSEADRTAVDRAVPLRIAEAEAAGTAAQ